MLSAYVLRGLYSRFVLVFSVLLFVLAIADVLMRLRQLPAVAFVPELFAYALPVIALFALPIAASIAVQTQIASWYENSAVVLFRSLGGMQHMLRRALMFFSFTLGLCYLPLVFEVAPRSARAGRSMVLSFAKEHLRKLEPGITHQLGGGSLIFFAKRNEREGALHFKKILLRMRDPHGSHVLSAQEGVMRDDRLYLYNGTMHTESKKHISASFASMHLDLDRVLTPPQESTRAPKASYLSLRELGRIMLYDRKAALEFNARLMRLLWMLMFPFLALAGIQWLGREGHARLAQSLGWSAGLFLVSYIIISVASACTSNLLIAYPLLYGGSVAVWWCVLRLGKGKW